MLLSILICTLEDRKEEFGKLYTELNRQADLFPSEVEVLFECDNRQIPTGKKRNILIDRAIGKYIAFVDDDDWIAPEYVNFILDAAKKNPDCIGIKGIINFKTKQWSYFTHSIECTGWYAGLDGYYRTPNHLNPVLHDIAKRVRFNNILSIGEDQDYSNRINKFLKTEVFIDKPIYHYWSRTKIR